MQCAIRRQQEDAANDTGCGGERGKRGPTLQNKRFDAKYPENSGIFQKRGRRRIDRLQAYCFQGHAGKQYGTQYQAGLQRLAVNIYESAME